MDGSFSWYSSLFINHSFSNVVAQYICYVGVLILTWLNDLWLINRRSSRLKPGGIGIGYISTSVDTSMSRRIRATQPTTCLILLGIVCDTARQEFDVPESKLETLDAMLNNDLDDG